MSLITIYAHTRIFCLINALFLSHIWFWCCPINRESASSSLSCCRWLFLELNIRNNEFVFLKGHLLYVSSIKHKVVMAQSQIICDASAMGKTRVIRTKSWDRSHDFAPVGGALRTSAGCRNFLGIATPVAVPMFEIKIVRLLARFFTHFGHPRHNLRWPTMPSD